MKRAFLLSIALCLGLNHLTTTATGAPPPNIIFIMADDLGWGDLGCYGQERIRTPHLDKMAAEGMRFTHAYAGSTVCAPSRSVLMTGQHTGHTRIRGNARHPLLPEDVTVAEILRDRGYATALIGKWGLGEPGTTGTPSHQGFDYYFGYLNQRHAHNYYPSFLWRDEKRVALANTVPDEDSVGAGVAVHRVDYSHDLFTHETLSWLRSNHRDPFFLYLALTIPHANNEARNKGMEVPDLRPYQNTDWPEAQKGHAAMITRMDRDLGKLFDLLKALRVDEQTIVFFTSDNGPHREGGNDPDFNDSNGPLRGIKRDLYEGGIRVPFIARWPGRIAAGTVNETPCYFADVMPTLAALSGAAAPQGIDGQNLAPLLLGQASSLEERFLYWEFHERGFQQAARRGPWKAVRPALNKPLELFNLAEDIGEQRDVARQHPDVVEQFEQFLAEARTESPLWPLRKAR